MTVNKIIQYDELFPQTDEPRIIRLDNLRKGGGYKYASESVHSFCETIEPKPGKVYVLVLAMSASDYYGPNKNGDAFAESPIMGPDQKWLVAPGETLLDHYKTFEKHAYVYAHHVNKDPAKSYGRPIHAFYNLAMHRVELVLEIDEHKSAGQFFLHRIEKGEYPGVSMGCRIKEDRCSICGHSAPTTADYCEHVNGFNSQYGMNRLLEDGRRCFVWNPSPLLFDISFVFRPADRIGYMLKKVASEAPYHIIGSRKLATVADQLSQKVSALRKVSEITKEVAGDVATVGEGRDPHSFIRSACKTSPALVQDMPSTTVARFKDESFQDVLSSMLSVGQLPTSRDVYSLVSATQGLPADPKVRDTIGRTQGALADALQDLPEIMAALDETGLLSAGPSRVKIHIAKTASEEMPGRALFVDNLMRQYVPESSGVLASRMIGQDPENVYYKNPNRRLTYTDPDTGKKYTTSMLAAEKADVENKKKLMAEGVGLSALLGLGVKSMTASGKMKYLAPAAAVGAGGLGHHTLMNQRVPRIQTDEGEYIPVNTELVQKTANEAAVLGSGSLLALLAMQDLAGHNPISGVAREHPIAATIAGTAATGKLADMFQEALTGAVKHANLDPVKKDVDFAVAATKIGQVIIDVAYSTLGE